MYLHHLGLSIRTVAKYLFLLHIMLFTHHPKKPGSNLKLDSDVLENVQPEDFNLVLTGNDPNPVTFRYSGFGAEMLIDAGAYTIGECSSIVAVEDNVVEALLKSTVPTQQRHLV